MASHALVTVVGSLCTTASTTLTTFTTRSIRPSRGQRSIVGATQSYITHNQAS
jgi:hypothetical protein